MNNSFYRVSDSHVDEFLIKLDADFFWSRRYEYPHILKELKKSDCVKVLDAACGSYHPFKFALAQSGFETYACDLCNLDFNMLKEAIGKRGYCLSEKEYYMVNFSKQDISNTNYASEFFDAVVCISVIEHLPKALVSKCISEFYRILKKGGKLYLTIDYPDMTPDDMLNICIENGFILSEKCDYTIYEDCISSDYFEKPLKCYNMILKKEVQ